MKGIVTLLLLSVSIISSAQNKHSDNVEIDERLKEVYEIKYLTSLQIQNPVLLQRWSYYLDNSFYIF